jgi:hypothetical protein
MFSQIALQIGEIDVLPITIIASPSPGTTQTNITSLHHLCTHLPACNLILVYASR